MLMPHQTLVESLPRQANGAIDVRRATFQDDADAVLEGVVVASYRALCAAIRDPRIQRPHLKVLANLTEKISYDTGTAWVSRRAIAAEEGLSDEGAENAVYDLRRWNYVQWERRVSPGNHPGRLLHYTLRPASVSTEQMRSEIEKWCAEHGKKVQALACGKSTPYGLENGANVQALGCTPKYKHPGCTTSPKYTLWLGEYPQKYKPWGDP
ncbi:MAG: hypothetical protein WBX25_29075 [Rhodomicrobium sp.]